MINDIYYKCKECGNYNKVRATILKPEYPCNICGGTMVRNEPEPPYTKPEPSQSVKPESLTNHSQSLASDLNAEPDMVNHPPHYANKTPETIQMIRAVLTKEEFIGYCKGQILKYRDRAHDKGNLEQDMAKAKFYYDLLEEVQE